MLYNTSYLKLFGLEEKDVFLWVPAVMESQSYKPTDKPILHKQGWRNPPSLMTLLYALSSQYSIVRGVIDPARDTYDEQGELQQTAQGWFHKDDIAFVKHYPVIFPLLTKTDSPPNGYSFQFGEMALIAVKDKSQHTLFINQLPDGARTLHARINEHMNILACPPGRDKSVILEEVHRMVQELAIAYYGSSQEQVPGRDGRLLMPSTHNAFMNGKTTIWSSVPFQAYNEAISNAASGATRWIEEQMGERSFRVSYLYKKQSGTTTIHLLSSPDEKNTEFAREKLWQEVRRHGEIHSDMYLVIIAQLQSSKHSRDKDGWTWITASRALDYRGLEPRTERTESGKKYTGGHRLEDIKDVAACFRDIRNTRITVDQVIYEEPEPGQGKRKGKSKTTRFNRESPLFQFGDVITKQQLWSDENGTDSPTTEVAWQIKESPWMQPFIQGTNRMVGTLLQETLKFDPKNHKWEKRLSKYLMFHLLMNQRRASISRNIAALLTELTLDVNERYQQRTRDRFEKALNTLKTVGYFKQWRYGISQDKKIVPISTNDLNRLLDNQKWLHTWLTFYIIFDAPDDSMTVEANITPGLGPEA